MFEAVKEVIRANDLAVLATCIDNQPYCSLMAYAARSDGQAFYMLTRKSSRKFANISANPMVSLMVDTRLNSQAQRSSIKALTVTGTCGLASEAEHDRLLDLLLQRHPQLKKLADQGDAVIIEIKAQTFLLLDGVSNAHFLDLSES